MVMNRDDCECLSAAMDGELDRDLGKFLVEHRHEDDLKDTWFAFHLIGDVLRDAAIPQTHVHARVAEALRQEPAYLLPAGGAAVGAGSRAMPAVGAMRGLAVAAAVLMVVLSTAALRPQGATTQVELAQQSVQPSVHVAGDANMLADKDIQTFVALHRQGSPLSDLQTVDYTLPAGRK